MIYHNWSENVTKHNSPNPLGLYKQWLVIMDWICLAHFLYCVVQQNVIKFCLCPTKTDSISLTGKTQSSGKPTEPNTRLVIWNCTVWHTLFTQHKNKTICLEKQSNRKKGKPTKPNTWLVIWNCAVWHTIFSKHKNIYIYVLTPPPPQSTCSSISWIQWIDK